MEIIKLLLPLITFVLGILATLYVKRLDYKKENLKQHANELSRLSEEWFNHLVRLSILAHNEKDESVIYANLFAYSNESLFLAKYRRSLEILGQYKKCKKLISESEAFLALLTEPNPKNSFPEYDTCMDSYFQETCMSEEIVQQEVDTEAGYKRCTDVGCAEVEILNPMRVTEVDQNKTSSRELWLKPQGGMDCKMPLLNKVFNDKNMQSIIENDLKGLNLSNTEILKDIHKRVQEIHIEVGKVTR